MHFQPGIPMSEVEAFWLKENMRYFHGNKTKVAASMGVSIRTVDAWIEKYMGVKDGLQKETKGSTDGESGIVLPSGGLQLEPTHEAPKKQPVPVRERKKGKGMSSKPAPECRSN